MANGQKIGATGIVLAFEDTAVAAVFDGFEADVRASLLLLRALIFEVAQGIEETGGLLETLKWGQPAYLPRNAKVGTTIRLGIPKSGGFGLYTHCQTSLMGDFSAQFGDEMRFDGNRGVLFNAGADVPNAAMRILIARALTYHLNK